MKKKPAAQPTAKELPWNNPFAALKLDLPKEPETPPPPPPPSPEELRRQALSEEDRKLLEAFGGAAGLSVGHDDAPAQPKGPRVSFNIQRKGKGGKTVTLVFGLKDLELTEQMTLGSQIQKALGIGARFEDGVLQLQGDQRERAAEWFATHGFRC